MSFRPENEARGAPPEGARRAGGGLPAEVVRRGDGGGGPPRPAARGLLLLVLGLVVLALAVGAVVMWWWFGDQTEGTSVFEDSIAAGAEPVVRLTNGPGQIRVEGAEGLEAVEITAKKYARCPDPAAAKENAADVDVNTSREGSTVEISSDGGGDT